MTKEGESFELEIKEALERELRQGEWGIAPECVKIFHRKAYYSQLRNKPIIMDVSIELYRPRLDTPYLIWVWECKDYKERVPVDDVEEFHAKLEQIKIHKTRATIVCRNGFQESSVAYAKSMGIGLARLLPDGCLIRTLEAVRLNRISKQYAELALSQASTEVFFDSNFFGLVSTGEGVSLLSDMIAYEIAHSP